MNQLHIYLTKEINIFYSNMNLDRWKNSNWPYIVCFINFLVFFRMWKSSRIGFFFLSLGERLSCIPSCTQIFWLPHYANSITTRLIQTERRKLQKQVWSLKQCACVTNIPKPKIERKKIGKNISFDFGSNLHLRQFQCILSMHTF